MKASQEFWLTSGGIVILGALVIGMLYAFDEVRVNRPIAPVPEVRRNEYLGAMRSLEKLGLKADRIGVLDAVSGSNAVDVLIVKADRPIVTERTRTRLRQFVEQGGVLVFETNYVYDDDPLADAFGVTRGDVDYDAIEDDVEDHGNEDDFVDGDDDTADDESSDEESEEWDEDAFADIENEFAADSPRDRLKNRRFADEHLRRIKWPGGDILLVHLYGAESLSRFRTEPLHEDRSGVHVIKFGLGKGNVVVINDFDFMTNFEIARNDHAEFLWRIIQLHDDPKRVLFYHADRQHLGDWLAKHAWAPLWMIGLLVFLLIWRGMPRFGPVADDPEPVRRRLLDHLRATGNFLARANQREEISQSALRVVLARVKREFPQLGLANDNEVRDFLVKQFALPPDCAFLIATKQTPATVLDWVRLMRACRDIHAALDFDALRRK